MWDCASIQEVKQGEKKAGAWVPSRENVLITYLQIKFHWSSGGKKFSEKFPENRALKKLESSSCSKSKFQEISRLRGKRTQIALA